MKKFYVVDTHSNVVGKFKVDEIFPPRLVKFKGKYYVLYKETYIEESVTYAKELLV